MTSVYPAYYVFYVCVDFLICEYLLSGIHEQDVNVFAVFNCVFESSPAFPDPAFEQIALYCSLEVLLWHRNKNTAIVKTIIRQIYIADMP